MDGRRPPPPPSAATLARLRKAAEDERERVAELAYQSLRGPVPPSPAVAEARKRQLEKEELRAAERRRIIREAQLRQDMERRRLLVEKLTAEQNQAIADQRRRETEASKKRDRDLARSEPTRSTGTLRDTLAGITVASFFGGKKTKKCTLCGGVKESHYAKYNPAGSKTFKEAYDKLKKLEAFYSPEDYAELIKDDFIFHFYNFLLNPEFNKKPYTEQALKSFDVYTKILTKRLENNVDRDVAFGVIDRPRTEYSKDGEPNKIIEREYYNFS